MTSLHCYTLCAETVENGIDPTGFDCIVAASPRVLHAEFQLIPVLENRCNPTLADAALCVSFLTESDGKQPSAEGAVLAYPLEGWRLTADKTRLILIDPAGQCGFAVVYLEKGCVAALESRRDPSLYLSVDMSGTPVIERRSRPAMLLAALTRSGIPSLQASDTPSTVSGKQKRKAAHKAEARKKGTQRTAD